MSIEMTIGLMTIASGIFVVWVLKHNAQAAKSDRIGAIERKLKEVNGQVIAIEQIDRSAYPFDDELTNPDMMYKLYRIRYEVEGKRKLGYGVLIIKQNTYGPALAMNTEWIWKF